MHLEIAQSTPTARSVGALVEQHYGLGKVVTTEFLRRSFNQVYRIGFDSGQQIVARLCSDRPRGGPNVAFEAQALDHWARAGCAVSRCVRTQSGAPSIQVQLPEGSRTLMLFEFLEGEFTSDSASDIQAFAQGLAALHAAGQGYDGTPSDYTLNLDYLLLRPLDGLLRAPTMTAEFRPQFEQLAMRLHREILALGSLTQVLCHGDAHGSNNFIVRDAQGKRGAVFFDFDEAGPGYLAYELAVYPWSLYPRTPGGVASDKVRNQWRQFIEGYRACRPVAEVDLAAIVRFMAVRQFWLLGEYAGRVPVWGSQAMPVDYLRRQLVMLKEWESLELPM